MIIKCHACTEGTTSAGLPCSICGGDGEIDLADLAFREIKYGPMLSLTGLIWDTILTNQSDMADKINDVLDKCNDIKDVADAIIAEQAAIRQDLTTAIGAIWNKVKDL